MINMQHSHIAMIDARMHIAELHERARQDRLARDVRDVHALRHGMGRLLIAAGTALVNRSLDPAGPEYVPVVAR